jgi:hypothetical protein
MTISHLSRKIICYYFQLELVFQILTVPNNANKNFPYHVRTTQIGVMEISDGVVGNNSLDHFGHHPYAPGGPPLPSVSLNPWPHVPVELFTIASSLQLVYNNYLLWNQ